jgi:hypothetical protein
MWAVFKDKVRLMENYEYKGLMVRYIEGPWDGYYTVTPLDSYDNLSDKTMTVLESEEEAEQFIDSIKENEYRGFRLWYIDNPTMGHWEVEGCDEEFETDTDAAKYVDTILETQS